MLFLEGSERNNIFNHVTNLEKTLKSLFPKILPNFGEDDFDSILIFFLYVEKHGKTLPTFWS
jgi:hypothetical protein